MKKISILNIQLLYFVELFFLFILRQTNESYKMKKCTLLLLLMFSLSAFSQEMRFDNGKIYFDGIEITPGIAKQKSQTVSMDAYTSFKKAGNIRSWNYFWAVLGGYELGVGSYNLAAGYGIGAVDMAIGGVCLGVIPSRESKRRMWMADGVKKYNSALQD